jgi:hypothetical protein
MREIEQVAVEAAKAVRHRLAPPADADRHVVIRQQHLPAAARILGVARHDIRRIDLASAIFALDAHHLVRPGKAVDHRYRSGKAAPAQMLLAQFAEPDPRLPHKPAAGKVDPGAHHRYLLQLSGS